MESQIEYFSEIYIKSGSGDRCASDYYVAEAYRQTQYVMNNAKTYGELFNHQRKWINDEFNEYAYGNGYGYNCDCLVRWISLDHGEDFVNLLRYMTDKLKMIITKCQSTLHSFQKDRYEPFTIYKYPVEIKEQLKQITQYEILHRPYVKGYVTIDMFWRIFKKPQDDLIIFGRLPYLIESSTKLLNTEEYNIYQPMIDINFYIKNGIDKADTKIRYYVKDKPYYCEIYNDFIHGHEYLPEIIRAAFERKTQNKDTWHDYIMCEIVIMHKRFGVKPELFSEEVHELCDTISDCDYTTDL